MATYIDFRVVIEPSVPREHLQEILNAVSTSIPEPYNRLIKKYKISLSPDFELDKQLTDLTEAMHGA